MDKKIPKAANKLPRRPRKKESKKVKENQSINPDNMTDLLFDTMGTWIQITLYSRAHCQDLIKALVYFVAYNPPSLTKNLFLKDQVSGVNTFNPCDLQERRARNWQYVYALINRHIRKERPDWMFKNETVLLVSQKSSACLDGSMMADYIKMTEPKHLAALVIAYWLGKLYSVSIYRAQPADLPEPLRHAYSMFIMWKGAKWESKKPSLPFRNEDMYEGEELRSLFPFADEYVQDPTLELNVKFSLNIRELKLKYHCNNIGEDLLHAFLAQRDQSFDQFVQTILKRRGEKKGSEQSDEEFKAEMRKFVGEGF